jgi:hypothetical protein
LFFVKDFSEKKAPSHWHTALLRYRQFLSFFSD